MLSGFKERLQLLRINLVNSYRQDTAYFWNNLGTLASTILYCVTYLAFLQIIFSNVKTIAGYTRDEMMLFALVGNVAFYLLFIWSYNNLDTLRMEVNRGGLDLLLTKPLPHLFHVSTRQVSVIMILREALPTSIIISFVIHWSNLHLHAWPVIAGIAVFCCGILLFHIIQFFLMLPVFWFGESGELFNLSYPLSDYDVPYEGWPQSLRSILTVIVPVLIAMALSTSVMLGKSDPVKMLLLVIGITAVGLCARAFAWRWALRNYTSASS